MVFRLSLLSLVYLSLFGAVFFNQAVFASAEDNVSITVAALPVESSSKIFGKTILLVTIQDDSNNMKFTKSFLKRKRYRLLKTDTATNTVTYAYRVRFRKDIKNDQIKFKFPRNNGPLFKRFIDLSSLDNFIVREGTTSKANTVSLKKIKKEEDGSLTLVGRNLSNDPLCYFLMEDGSTQNISLSEPNVTVRKQSIFNFTEVPSEAIYVLYFSESFGANILRLNHNSNS